MGTEFQQIFAHRMPDDAEPGPTWIPPAWIGPPSDELGEPVPLSLVVARSERALVAVRHATAYSSGVVLDVLALGRGLSERDTNRLMHEQHLYPDEEERSPGFLHIGVELPGGRRVSNLGTPAHRLTSPDDEPDEPVLIQSGGGGGSAGDGQLSLEHRYWLWPLPEDGTMRLYVEWPALEISLSTAEVDTSALREAAERSQRLWSDA